MKVNRKPREPWTYPQDPPPRTTGHKPTPPPPDCSRHFIQTGQEPGTPPPAKREVPTGLVTPNPRPEPPLMIGVVLKNSTRFQAAMGRLCNSLDGLKDACGLMCESINEMEKVVKDDLGDDK